MGETNHHEMSPTTMLTQKADEAAEGATVEVLDDEATSLEKSIPVTKPAAAEGVNVEVL